MILESIVIQDFRKLVDRLVIDGLEPGLNLICGPNEAGKSTIAEAVRTVFLERYKVTGLGALVPNARPDGLPSVEVTFDVGGVKHHLAKQFVKRQRCSLRIGTKAFDADEAEEELAKLIGFSRTERGTSRPENAGIPGLLWVRQGQTGDVRDPGGHAASYIREALTKLVGGEMPSDDALIGAVRQDLFKLVTERARKPTGELAAVENAIARLEEEQKALEQQMREFDEETTRLGQLQADYERMQKERPWEAMREKAAAADARVASFQTLERAHEELAQKLKVVAVEHGALVEKEQLAAALEASVQEDRAALDRARTAAQQADAAHERAQAAVDQAQKANDDASVRLVRANAAERGVELRAQLDTQGAEIVRLETTLSLAVESSAKFQELTREAALAEIDEKQLVRLGKVYEQIVPLLARRDAALTRIQYRLTGAITIDGAPVQGDGVVLLDGERTLELPGLGELTIVPGVSDLSATLAELQSLEAAHDKLILDLGIAGYAQGVERHARWRALCADRDGYARLLDAHAPNGLERLRSDLEQARGRCAATRERLGALPDVTGALPVAEAQLAADASQNRLEGERAAMLESSSAKA